MYKLSKSMSKVCKYNYMAEVGIVIKEIKISESV